jgi:hypothetical protein
MDYNSNGRDTVLNNAIFGSLGPLGHKTSFLWDCVKDDSSLLPTTTNIPEPECRITTRDKLPKVWEQKEHSVDIFCLIHGAQIEYLQGAQTTFTDF